MIWGYLRKPGSHLILRPHLLAYEETLIWSLAYQQMFQTSNVGSGNRRRRLSKVSRKPVNSRYKDVANLVKGHQKWTSS